MKNRTVCMPVIESLVCVDLRGVSCFPYNPVAFVVEAVVYATLGALLGLFGLELWVINFRYGFQLLGGIQALAVDVESNCPRFVPKYLLNGCKGDIGTSKAGRYRVAN